MIENPVIFKTQEGTSDLITYFMKVGQDFVVIWGGEKPHISAVALAQPRECLKYLGKISTTASVPGILGHKRTPLSKPYRSDWPLLPIALWLSLRGYTGTTYRNQTSIRSLGMWKP